MLVRRLAALAALLAPLLACAPGVSAQGPPSETPPARPGRRAAAPDTAAFFPRWMHPWLELGGGWLVSPEYMRHFYDSGQGFAAGLAVTPWRRIELRAAIDYQMVQAHHTGLYVIDWGTGPGGAPLLDTLTVDYDGTAWSALLRAETGLRLGWGFAVTGGLGAGYMNGGFQDQPLAQAGGLAANPPAPMLNGWGWAWTAAARWDVEPDPMIPLGLDVRSTSMRRGHDFVRWWSIRMCYRIPDPVRRTGPHRGRRDPGRS